MQCPFCKEEIQEGALKCKHCGSMLYQGQPPQLSGGTGQADFGQMFTSALNIWKGNLNDLIILTLVLCLLVWIPIANIGFLAGYTRSLLKVARGQGRARVADLFNAWDCFGNLFAFFLLNLVVGLILSYVPLVGMLASVMLGFFLLPGLFAVIDRGLGVIDACKWSFETIQRDFVNWLLAYMVGSVIAYAGLLALVIGIILSLSLGQLIIITQYERQKPA